MQEVEYSQHLDSKKTNESMTNLSEKDQKIGISVICPYYNEAGIIEEAVMTMVDKLQELEATWELFVVHDGSADGSDKIVEELLNCPILLYINLS